MSAQHRVAVYGTLRDGQRNHAHYLGRAGATYVGECELPGYVMMEVWAGVPGIIPTFDKRMSVVAEIYDIDGPVLQQLDLLESIDTEMYRRAAVHLPVYGKVYCYEIGPKTFKNIYKGGRELMMFQEGDFTSKEKWGLLRADVGQILDPAYLKECGLWAMANQRTGKEVVVPPPTVPTKPAFDWVKMYGPVRPMEKANAK